MIVMMTRMLTIVTRRRWDVRGDVWRSLTLVLKEPKYGQKTAVSWGNMSWGREGKTLQLLDQHGYDSQLKAENGVNLRRKALSITCATTKSRPLGALDPNCFPFE